VLHHGRDLRLLEEHALLVADQEAEVVAVLVDDVRVARGLELELRQVGRDGHHHPEDGRDRGEDAEAEEQQEQADLADAHAPARRLGRRRLRAVGAQRDDGGAVAGPTVLALVGGARRRTACAFVIAH
jgi:hypothetical protein